MKWTEQKCRGSGEVFSLVVLGLVIWYGINFYNGKHKAAQIEKDYGYKVETTASGKVDCTPLEPSNPYSEESGHYAGYEWANQGHYCTGNSNSFIEGCQEYQNQRDAFNVCVDKEVK